MLTWKVFLECFGVLCLFLSYRAPWWTVLIVGTVCKTIKQYNYGMLGVPGNLPPCLNNKWGDTSIDIRVSEAELRKALSYQSRISNKQMLHLPTALHFNCNPNPASPQTIFTTENKALIDEANVIFKPVSKPFVKPCLMWSERSTVSGGRLMARIPSSNQTK